MVYNLAAVHRDDVKPVTRYDEVNVAGATNICGVCRELGIERLIFTSSAAVYGMAAPDTAKERPRRRLTPQLRRPARLLDAGAGGHRSADPRPTSAHRDSDSIRVRLPRGHGDLVAAITGRPLPISAIRVRKFCTTTFSAHRLQSTGFKAPPPPPPARSPDQHPRWWFVEWSEEWVRAWAAKKSNG